eukprot:3479615-Rhodomonas_salina.4
MILTTRRTETHKGRGWRAAVGGGSGKLERRERERERKGERKGEREAGRGAILERDATSCRAQAIAASGREGPGREGGCKVRPVGGAC